MYGKVFAQMYDGTLVSKGPWQALVTFQQFIVLSDRFGVVDMTADAIARRTGLPIEVIVTGIEALEREDEGSRTPDEGGRRIVRLDEHRTWGWRIVNYAKYRQLFRQQDRQDYMRDYMRTRRAEEKTHTKSDGNRDVNTEKLTVNQLAYSNASGFNTKKNNVSAEFQRFWDAYPSGRKIARAKCAAKWATHGLDEVAERIVTHVRAMAATEQWQREGGRYVPNAETYLNRRQWEDETPPSPRPTRMVN